MGSGLRPDVWRRFLERFGAIRIVETYGLTEGNVTLFNYTGTPGAVGRSSFIYKVLGALGGRGWGLGWGIPRPRPRPSILTPRSPSSSRPSRSCATTWPREPRCGTRPGAASAWGRVRRGAGDGAGGSQGIWGSQGGWGSQGHPPHTALVPAGETGLLIAPVTPRTPFLGYAGSQELSEQKLLRGVFAEGDTYFSTGDLVEQDAAQFVRFRDRTGDTYRWC